MSSDPDQLDAQKLANALRAAYSHTAAIPQTVEENILSAAHQKFAQRRRLRLLARWGTGLAAGLAATLALIIFLKPSTPAQSVAKGDLNADGQLNMVDALVLSKHIAAKDKLEKSWDINNDGQIDQKDADALATAAVSLKQGGLAQNSLPRFDDLNIHNLWRNAGLASASGTSSPSLSLAEASPTKNEQDHQ